jgi:hypothetical protein
MKELNPNSVIHDVNLERGNFALSRKENSSNKLM